MLDGYARKIGLGLAGGTFVSWLLIVIGFALLTSDTDTDFPQVGPLLFPYWMISIGGLPLIALACVHAIVSTPARATRILRAVISFFSVLFLVCLGMVLFLAGTALIITSSNFPFHSNNLLFAGSLLATITWACLMVLWTFYEEPLRTRQSLTE